MLVDPLVDNHIHTTYCNHAKGRMEEYVLSAINRGLEEICFLEHMEEGIRSRRVTWLSDDDFDSYWREGKRLRHKYSRNLKVKLGVEVGYNPFFQENLLVRLSRYPWDRIGISYHFHQSGPFSDHLNLVSRSDARVQTLTIEEAEAILLSYFRNLKKAVDYLPGDMVCHLDAAFRYHPQSKFLSLPWDDVVSLLESVKMKKMAIEMNTSGLAIRGEIFPCKKITDIARKMGIPFSAGSDAHTPEQVGNGFNTLDRLFNR